MCDRIHEKVAPSGRPRSYALGICRKSFVIHGSHGAAIVRIPAFLACLARRRRTGQRWSNSLGFGWPLQTVRARSPWSAVGRDYFRVLAEGALLEPHGVARRALRAGLEDAAGRVLAGG